MARPARLTRSARSAFGRPFAIFAWPVSVLLRWLGPGSAFGRVLEAIGIGVAGSEPTGNPAGVPVPTAPLPVGGGLPWVPEG